MLRLLQLCSPEGCFSSVEFLFSNRKDALVVTEGLPEISHLQRANWRAAAEVLGTLGSWGH